MLKKEQIFIFTLIFTALLPLAIAFTIPSSKLNFIACNVGQGDAILITKGFTQILIDGGPNEKVLTCLSQNIPFWDRKIELVIATHQDNDHIGGLDDVIQGYSVTQFVWNGQTKDSQSFQSLQGAIKDNNIPTHIPSKDEQIKIGDISFKVLWPSQNNNNSTINNYNNRNAAASQLLKNKSNQVLGKGNNNKKNNVNANKNSIVLHMQYHDFDALLTGDITEREEKQIIQQNEFHDIELLKVPHHGSKYSSCAEFLKAVNPSLAIISVGKNPWGHPTKEVLNRLESVNSQILRTDIDEIKLRI